MSYLANKIVDQIPFDFHQRNYKTKEESKKKYINKKRVIEIDDVTI